MTPPNTAKEDMTSPGSTGPGDRLKAARIENGMSIEDIAARMHLSVGILKAIEENNFDDITAPIFVKGYLRSYARIVSLGEDEMIHQYLNYYSDEDPPISPTSHLPPELSPDDARIKWTTFLVVVGLLGFLSFWWWSQYQAKPEVVSLDTEQTDSMQLAEAPSDTVIGENQVVDDASVVGEIDVSLLAADEPTVADPVVKTKTQEPVNLEPAEPEISDLAQKEMFQEMIQEEAAQVQKVQQEVGATKLEVLAREVSRIAPMGGTEQLDIVIHADTWVDIKDANGHQLVYELLRADQEVNLIGSAPFSVFLGNAHGVNLIFNNETIDFSRRIRDDNTARVKIGS